jgi:hypothetical protein
MTISAIPGNTSVDQSTTTANSKSSGSPASGSTMGIGTQLLAELAQSEASMGATSDPLLSYVVALNPQSGAAGTTAASSTYNAQGMLAQVQAGMLLNDPLFTTGTSGSSSGVDGLFGTQSGSSILDQLTSGLGAAATTGSNASDGTTNSDGSPTLASLIQSNPKLAVTLENSRIEQQFINMLP